MHTMGGVSQLMVQCWIHVLIKAQHYTAPIQMNHTGNEIYIEYKAMPTWYHTIEQYKLTDKMKICCLRPVKKGSKEPLDQSHSVTWRALGQHRPPPRSIYYLTSNDWKRFRFPAKWNGLFLCQSFRQVYIKIRFVVSLQSCSQKGSRKAQSYTNTSVQPEWSVVIVSSVKWFSLNSYFWLIRHIIIREWWTHACL